VSGAPGATARPPAQQPLATHEGAGTLALLAHGAEFLDDVGRASHWAAKEGGLAGGRGFWEPSGSPGVGQARAGGPRALGGPQGTLGQCGALTSAQSAAGGPGARPRPGPAAAAATGPPRARTAPGAHCAARPGAPWEAALALGAAPPSAGAAGDAARRRRRAGGKASARA
jgi:hypothetical protein